MRKNHLEDWGTTGYSPGDDFDEKFGTDFFGPDITLLDAVKMKGGNCKALVRHGAAALLSAAQPNVAYPLTVEQVIALVSGALNGGDCKAAKGTLETYNELGCDCSG